ncbi:class I adenylate-forming enzyme family protein [Agromyces sp. Marseille-P2726]|uniref:class I adenylate-forming enzyme family protein n=1 Tax=Agromyces sp. Marseille-P2726 TaxID=2709132 RepID=UPI001C2D3104|nr:class I adenylate-forming enzyme family protein [Agromyces sp. Marseille-P2726]
MGTYSGAALRHPATPSDLLRAGLERDPRGPAVVSARSRLSWEALDELTGRLAAGYLALGLEPGDRIASLMPNRYELIAHYLACFRAGLIATPLNYRYTVAEIDHALDVSEARMLLTHVEREPDLAASERVARLPLGTIGYLEAENGGSAFQGLVERERHGSDPRPMTPEPGAPAVIFFTSGSTGPPKGVTHTHRTLGWMFATAAAALEFGAGDLVLAGSSLSHVGAFYVSFGALSAGAAIAIARTFDGDELLGLLRDDRPTVLSMLPSALFALTRDHGATRHDFASLRLCRAAGDKVSAELEREFTALTGFTIDEAYGLSETGLVSVSPPAAIRIGSVGQAAPGVSLSLRDDAGDVVEVGGEGRAWIRTEAACVGYWGDSTATDAAFADGWLDTGDVMRADPDGYFYFEGRRKQIIVHDGSNISPQEIEDVLEDHPCVDSAGVIGIRDEIHGENVRAYITLREGTERPRDVELIRFARARVGYKAPEEIVVLDEMPCTATGKVDRAGLKRMAEASIHRGRVR